MDALILILILLLAAGAILIVLFVFPDWIRKLRDRFFGRPGALKGTEGDVNQQAQTDHSESTETDKQFNQYTPENDPERQWTSDEPVSDQKKKSIGLTARIRYYLKGNELGFTNKELKLIKNVATRYGVFDPDKILIAKAELGVFLRLLVTRGFKDGLLNEPVTADVIYKLFAYRLDIERNRPKYRRGIASTRTIPGGQELRISIPGFGTYSTKLIENYRPYLCVEIPVVRRAGSMPISWKSREIEVSFWRPHDGLYSFESVVMNDPAKAETRAVLNISHSDHLVRTQKRSNVRVAVMKNGYVMPLNTSEEADETIPPNKGWLCRVTDISSSGAAILVRGRVRPGKLLKLTIELGGVPVVMSGEVKAVNLDPKRGVSLLHLEAIPLSKGMRSRVIAYTLGLLTDKKPQQLSQEKDEDENQAQPAQNPATENLTPESLFGIKQDDEGDPDFDRSLGLGNQPGLNERDLDEVFPDEDEDRANTAETTNPQ